MEIKQLIDFRHKIHQNPELSGDEKQTTEMVSNYLIQLELKPIITLGEGGIACVIAGAEHGPVVLFRAELDALPINENTTIAYKSKSPGISHVCGHDGHMTMLLGLAEMISKTPPKKGKVILLFQAAEETGQGAQVAVEKLAAKDLQPDFVFALHNIPGYEQSSILVRNRNFAAASRGLCIKLQGKTSHAAEPENGINPAMATSRIIVAIKSIIEDDKIFQGFVLATPIHIRLGERAFGTSAGEAELLFTLRSFENEDMEVLIQQTESIVRKIAAEEKLGLNISYCEIFPATINNRGCVEILRESAREAGLNITELNTPFRWSEDFGHFTGKYPGSLFGLGSGLKQPALHNPDYDFPDDILPAGIQVFYNIYKKILEI